MVQAPQIEVPETWDTIKRPKPIYPTYSRGKFGGALYTNSKYHCYGGNHSKPFYELMPYRAKGFAYGERSMKYIPLTHVQDRSKPKPPKVVNEKSEMKGIYEASIDKIKSRSRRENECQNIQNQTGSFRKRFNFPRNLVADEIIGSTRYRTHVINQVVKHYELL